MHDEKKIEEIIKKRMYYIQKSVHYNELSTCMREYAEHLLQHILNKMCCTECSGTGAYSSPTDYSPCTFCDGTGYNTEKYGSVKDFINLINKEDEDGNI